MAGATSRGHDRCDGVAPLHVAPAEHDAGGATLREQPCRGLAEFRKAAGDDDDLAIEAHVLTHRPRSVCSPRAGSRHQKRRVALSRIWSRPPLSAFDVATGRSRARGRWGRPPRAKPWRTTG